MMQEARDAADEVIEGLKEAGKGDYSAHRAAIEEGFNSRLLSGDSDFVIDCPGLKDIRVIQEDHYEQHMDHEDDRPDEDDMEMTVSLTACIWLV